MKKEKSFYLAIFLLIFWIFLAFVAPYFSPQDPEKVNLALKLQSPSKEFLLGTDALGRDIFSRILYGAKLSLSISLLINLILLSISIPVGLWVGWKEGNVLKIFDWLANIMLTFPSFLLAMVFVGILGSGILNMILAVTIVEWIFYAKIIKNLVISQKECNYVIYARLKKMPSFYIIKKHILPFVYGPILIAALMNVGNVILMISSFSFLGIGVQPTVAEWGNMIHDSRTFFRNHPNMMLYPGLMILFAVSSFHFIGEEFEKKFKGVYQDEK